VIRTRFITAVRASGFPEFSQVSVLALFAWCPDASAVLGVQAFSTVATVRGVTAHAMRRAVRLLESLAACQLSADDAIVAATAIEHSVPLYTLDPPRFAPVAGVTALQPY
jgi:predicted nucleic acid-binding protein